MHQQWTCHPWNATNYSIFLFIIPGMCVCCIDQQQSYREQEIIEDYSLKMNKYRESFRSIWLDLWKLLVIQLQLQQKSKNLISSITDFVMFMITSNEVISFKTSLHYCVGREGGIWIAHQQPRLIHIAIWQLIGK